LIDKVEKSFIDGFSLGVAKQLCDAYSTDAVCDAM
jgi:hypothetical protein